MLRRFVLFWQGRPALAGALLVAGACVVAYANSLDGAFHFDDRHHILDNAALRDAGNIPRYFHRVDDFSDLSGHRMYRPVALATYAINYDLGGYEPRGWRLTALALHALCAVGLFLVLRVLPERLTGRRVPGAGLGALVAALLFSVHPLLTETVDYASARASLLAALGVVWAVFLHQRALAARRPAARVGFELGAMTVFAAALLSKEIAIVLPALLLALARFQRRHYVAVLPSVAVAAAYLVLRDGLLGAAVLDFDARAAAVAAADPGSGGARPIAWNLFTQVRVVAAYVALFFVPDELSVYRDVRVSTTPFELPVLAAGLALAGLAFAAWRLRRRRPLFSFGVLWFFVALAPTSSIIPLNQVMNERRVYLPAMGLAMAVAALLPRLVRRRPRLTGAIALAVLFAFAIRTQVRNRDWADPVRLWESAVEVSPRSSGAWNELGVQLRARGDLDQAHFCFRRAHDLDERGWTPVFNLGTLAGERGRYDEARAWLEQALARKPDGHRAKWYLAETAYAAGDPAEAERIFRELAATSPKLYMHTRYPLAKLARDRRGFAEAERCYHEALLDENDPAAAWLGLAAVARDRGDRGVAAERARRAAAADPSSPAAHLFLARLYRGTPRAATHLGDAERRGARLAPAEKREIVGG